MLTDERKVEDTKSIHVMSITRMSFSYARKKQNPSRRITFELLKLSKGKKALNNSGFTSYSKKKEAHT